MTSTLDLKTQMYRVHALTRASMHVKFESAVINSYQENDRKPFGLPADGQTDGRTDRPTDRHLRRGHNYEHKPLSE